MTIFDHNNILVALAAVLQKLVDDDVIKEVRRWDDRDFQQKYNLSKVPFVAIQPFGEDTSPGLESDTLWRHFGIRIRCASSYSINPDTRFDPESSNTAQALSTLVRNTISENPTLGLMTFADETEPWIELELWGPAEDGVWTDLSNSTAGPLRDITCRWQVLEQFDGGVNPQPSGLYPVNMLEV